MRASILAVLMLVGAALAVPTVQAHNCNSGEPGGCGPCEEGESHAHNDPSGQCATSATPGFETVTLLGAAVVALGVVHLRRR